jgi:hypothetical protein
MLRNWTEQAIRFHLTTAFAAALLLAESMQVFDHSISWRLVSVVFAITLGIYNGYRLVFQRMNLKKNSIKKWPVRFQVRLMLVIISFVYFICFWKQQVWSVKLITVGLCLFVLYTSSWFPVVSAAWLRFLGWIKAPLLALGWFGMTAYVWFDSSPVIGVNSGAWCTNRFGLLLLLALSNDVHDREKDAARGLHTWAVRFNRHTMQGIGLLIGVSMMATTIGYAGKWDVMLLTETGLLHALFGVLCFFLSFSGNPHFRHVFLMDASLIAASLLVFIANYLRNLPL